MINVLLVSNDGHVNNLIEKTLSYSGLTLHKASKVSDAWNFLSQVRYNFIMIDTQIDDDSGLSFYKSLRHSGNQIPVMMIGEGELDYFLLKDLSEKNYDFMIRPLKFIEIEDKVNLFLRKIADNEEIFTIGEFEVDCRQQTVIFRDKLLQLSRVEIEILTLLVHKSGEVIHPKKILKLFDKENRFYTLPTFYYINQLRKKLRVYGENVLEICFIRNQGYKLNYYCH